MTTDRELELKKHECLNCGYRWTLGQDGDHNCVVVLTRRVAQLREALEAARDALDSCSYDWGEADACHFDEALIEKATTLITKALAAKMNDNLWKQRNTK